MLEERKYLKDTKTELVSAPVKVKDISFNVSYNKTNKLITALYIVTDIIDSSDPIRQKLRTLGNEILSDILAIRFAKSPDFPSRTLLKVTEVLSFLNIAFTIGNISEMNFKVLKKEFTELKLSIEESIKNWQNFTKYSSLTEYFSDTKNNEEDLGFNTISDTNFPNSMSFSKGHNNGHLVKESIGVQKGSTLLQALSDRFNRSPQVKDKNKKDHDQIKKERRFEITKVLKDKSEGMTIKDINLKINDVLLFSSEKTLQRELVNMVKDNVLKKVGSKRWSKYFLVNV